MDTYTLRGLQVWCDASSEGLLVVDTSGGIHLINSRLRDWLHLSGSPETVDDLLDQIDAPVKAALGDVLPSKFDGTETRSGNITLEQRAARQVYWEQRPVKENDAVAGLVIIFRDSAPRSERELGTQSFLSMISHDLRTPLSTILGFAELLYHNLGSFSGEEQKEFLEHIIKNANQLSRYTQIALDIMFLEADLQGFATESVDLVTFVKRWLSDAVHRFPSDRLVFQNGINTNPLADISPSALYKILQILVEFALEESSPDGEVAIRLEYEKTRARITIEHRAAELSVKDAEKLFRLMEPRDLSESARPKLHRMQMYVARLLAERQHGFLTLNNVVENTYQIDLVLPLSQSSSD